MSDDRATPAYSTFTALYASGYLIEDPALLTALCLLFEHVYIPNTASHLINLAKEQSDLSVVLDVPEGYFGDYVELSPTSFTFGIQTDDGKSSPLAQSLNTFTPSVRTYLWRAARFYTEYMPLFGPVLRSNLYKEVPLDYRYSPVLIVNDGDNETKHITDLVRRGAIPVVENEQTTFASPSLATSRIAALLAIKSALLTFPMTHAARAEDILESRERLQDLLPPFWASMLRTSSKLQGLVSEGVSPEILEKECAEYVNANIRPALIELNAKLQKERLSWFNKIINPVDDGLTLALSRSTLSTADLVFIGLKTVTDTIKNTLQGSMPRDATLAYLIKLDKINRGL